MNPLSRRDSLTRTSAMAAYATIPALLKAQTSGDYLFPAGIQLYAVRDPLASDAPGTLEALRSIGFQEVERWLWEVHRPPISTAMRRRGSGSPKCTPPFPECHGCRCASRPG